MLSCLKTAEFSSYCRDLSVSLQRSFLSPALTLLAPARSGGQDLGGWQEPLLGTTLPTPPAVSFSWWKEALGEQQALVQALGSTLCFRSFLSCSVTRRSAHSLHRRGSLSPVSSLGRRGWGRWGAYTGSTGGRCPASPLAAPFLTGQAPFPGQQGSRRSYSTQPFSSSSSSPESLRAASVACVASLCLSG